MTGTMKSRLWLISLPAIINSSSTLAQNWGAGARGLGALVGHEFTPHVGRELHYTFQNGGAKLGGWLHDFVPLLGISHERWRQ